MGIAFVGLPKPLVEGAAFVIYFLPILSRLCLEALCFGSGPLGPRLGFEG